MTLRVILTGLLLAGTAQAGVLGLTCVNDERPYDGPKKELTIKKNPNGTYAVTFAKTYRKTWAAPETTETQELMKEAECAFDQKELVGDCFESHTKKEQKYLTFSSRVSRFYNSATKGVEQSPLMLDFRFDDLSNMKDEVSEYKYFERKNCSLIEG